MLTKGTDRRQLKLHIPNSGNDRVVLPRGTDMDGREGVPKSETLNGGLSDVRADESKGKAND